MSVWQKGDPDPPRQARYGDVAVFQWQSRPSTGHVTFFRAVSRTQPKSIDILGGNQRGIQNGNRYFMISEDSIRIDGDLELIAIRTMEGLRRA